MTRQLLWTTALGILAYMTFAWLVARERQRLDTVDTAYGIGFVVLAIIVLAQQPSLRSALLVLLVGLWGVRLSRHLYKRSAKRSEDPRYLTLSEKWQGNI